MNNSKEMNHKEETRSAEENENEIMQIPDILIVKSERENKFEGIFEAALSGVKRKEEYTFEDLSENKTISSVTRHMEPGDKINFFYSGSHQTPFDWRIQGIVSGKTEAEAEDGAMRLHENTLLGIHAECMDYQFTPLSVARMKTREGGSKYETRAVSDRLEIRANTRHDIGFKKHGEDSIHGPVLLRLPLLTEGNSRASNRIPLVLRHAKEPVTICCSITCVQLSSADLNLVECTLEWLQHTSENHLEFNDSIRWPLYDKTLLDTAQKVLSAWLNKKTGYHYEVRVISKTPIPASLLGVAANDLLPMQHTLGYINKRSLSDTAASPDKKVCDLSNMLPLGHAEPVLFPDPRLLLEMDAPRMYNTQYICSAPTGNKIGYLRQGFKNTTINFSERDRDRHCYIIGATGTGKSTLLANMIVQDIKAGEGVSVLDPHGDLFQQIIPHIPNNRLKDLVLIDPTDDHHVTGINLLECSSENRDMEINFNINEMMQIFHKLYHSETMGPMFENYMRTAMLILMDQKVPRDASLLEVIRIFQDKKFRASCIEGCNNDMAKAFWEQTAEKCSGDQSLPNMGAYVTSKLNTFTYNRLIRNIVCQRKSTVDFHMVMDTRKILLVNLSKGALGQLNSRFLGMLITGKIFSAALSRIKCPESARVPHYLYIDEFQNFTTDTVAYMMSEARKFQLRITLANQNMNQIQANLDYSQDNVLEAVLGNVGTMLCFRTGPMDTAHIEKYTLPEINAQDLQYLPDFHVAAKLLVNGTPVRPFVFQTLPFTKSPLQPIHTTAINLVKRKYTCPVDAVEKEIEQTVKVNLEIAPEEPRKRVWHSLDERVGQSRDEVLAVGHQDKEEY